MKNYQAKIFCNRSTDLHLAKGFHGKKFPLCLESYFTHGCLVLFLMIPLIGMIGYGMAKAAVHQLVKSLADPKGGLPDKSTVVGILP